MQPFRTLLRIAILLCLAAAAVSLLAQSGEYPGNTAAGRRVVLRDVAPLPMIAWVHLRALEGTYRWHRIERGWIVAATLADIAMLAWTAPAAVHGAPPLGLALPIIAILLLVSVFGLAAMATRRASGRSDY